MVEYTTGSAVAAGVVVSSNNMVGIVHTPLEANRVGSVDVSNGTAVYEATKASAATTYALGAKVEFDASSNAVASSGVAVAGICVKASANGDTTVWLLKCNNLA